MAAKGKQLSKLLLCLIMNCEFKYNNKHINLGANTSCPYLLRVRIPQLFNLNELLSFDVDDEHTIGGPSGMFTPGLVLLLPFL